MDKKQYRLLLEVLRRFQEKGILKNIILIGSWCVPLYKENYQELENVSTLRTSDMDFLVPLNAKFKEKIDVFELVQDLGFEEQYFGSEGYIKLIHAYLSLEFLVPQRGSGKDKPHRLSELGINAQPLPFLDMLTEKTITVNIDGIRVNVPHPVIFAFHKLAICEIRTGPEKDEKAEKDKRVAIQILTHFVEAKKIAPIKGLFRPLHKNRKKSIIKVLEAEEEDSILEVLREN
jgi:hypothetical protein